VSETNPLVLDEKTKLTWWEMRPATLRVPYTSWAEIKKFIISTCKENQNCSEITSWDRTVSEIDEWISGGMK
jgi:hypothetical protein